MTINMKTLGWLAALLFAGLLTWALLRPEVVAVEVAPAAKRTLSVTIEEQGRTRARDTYVVAAPVTGLLQRPEVEAGFYVTTGTVLARIAVPPNDRRATAIAEAALTAAEASRDAVASTVTEAEGVYARSRQEQERREELAKTGVTPAEELASYQQATESAEARLQSLRASLQAADAEVERARAQLLGSMPATDAGIVTVDAPVEGMVYRVFEESERVVTAGTSLFELSGENHIEVVADFITQDAVQIASGQPLLLTGWGGEPLAGVVTRVEPQGFTKISALGVEEQRVTVIGQLLTVPPGLGAEYRVDLQVEVWKQDDVLTVPVSAVFRRDGEWQVFALEEGRARLRVIEVGRRGRDYLQVLAGLEPGTEVIVFPSDLVTDGVRVEPEN